VEAELEEQDEEAEFAERVHRGVARIDERERAAAEQHTGEQFAEDGRLPEPPRKLAQELRRDDDGRKREQE
jgi:hypothetical protein